MHPDALKPRVRRNPPPRMNPVCFNEVDDIPYVLVTGHPGGLSCGFTPFKNKVQALSEFHRFVNDSMKLPDSFKPRTVSLWKLPARTTNPHVFYREPETMLRMGATRVLYMEIWAL